MTSDPSNPFLKLTGKFPDKSGKTGARTTIARSSSSGGRAGSISPGKSKNNAPAASESMDEEQNFAELMNAPDGKRETDADEAAFAEAMRGVAPVNGKGRVVAPAAKQTGSAPAAADPNLALREVLEGRLEFALYHSDEYMEGHVAGVDPAVLSRLRAGQLSPEAHLDLHGQNARQAFEGLTWFMKSAYQRNLRTVTVVTGRGRNSPGGQGVLRPLLAEWLSKDPFKRVVLAFCTAKSSDGGPGAVYVLLRKYKKSRGKIVWEQYLPDNDAQG